MGGRDQVRARLLRNHVPERVMSTVVPKLKQMLIAEVAGHELPVKRSGGHTGRTVKAVLKELYMKMGNNEVTGLSLLLQEDCIYKDVSETVQEPHQTFFQICSQVFDLTLAKLPSCDSLLQLPSVFPALIFV